MGLKTVHKPQYQTPEGYTDEPLPTLAMERVLYSMCKFQVELMAGGELSYGSLRKLEKGSWGLFMEEREAVHFLFANRARAQRYEAVWPAPDHPSPDRKVEKQ